MSFLDDEIRKSKSRLAELRHRDKNIKRQAGVHFITLREILDPYTFEDDYSKIDAERAACHVEELRKLVKEGRQVREQIKKIEGDLDG
jgi:hypothetical protein